MNNQVWKTFAAHEVSHSMAHYLTTIHDLQARRGYARVSDVAKELEVTKGSASVQVNDETRELMPATSFSVRELKLSPEAADDRQSVLQFQQQSADLYRRVAGAVQATAEIETRIEHLQVAMRDTPSASQRHLRQLGDLTLHLDQLKIRLLGDQTVQSRREGVPWSLQRRAGSLLSNWQSQSPITGTAEQAYGIASAEYAELRELLLSLDRELGDFETELNEAGAPWTPGRLIN